MQKNVWPIPLHNGVHGTARALLAMALFLLCTAFVTAGSHSPTTVKADGWVFDKSVNNVDFYHMLSHCNGKTVVLLKFNNKNDYKVKVTWKEVFATQLEKAAEGFNGKKQLFIGPGETFSSGCKDDKLKEMLVLPEQVAPTYIVTILGFEFKDIDVSLVL